MNVSVLESPSVRGSYDMKRKSLESLKTFYLDFVALFQNHAM